MHSQRKPFAIEKRSVAIARQLHSPIPKIRRSAARELTDLRDKSTLPQLIEAFRREKNSNTKGEIARNLELFYHKSATSALIEALIDESPEGESASS